MAATEISHDKLFKTVFKEFLKDLVELVHPQLAALLDLDRARFVDKEAFADHRKSGHVSADLVAETTSLEQPPQQVLIHVETEYDFLKAFDARMAGYGLQLTLKYDRPVISLVVFLHGGKPGLEIREVKRRVGSFEPTCYRFLAYGLSRSLAEENVGRPQPLAAGLAALMRSRRWDKPSQKVHCLRAIGQAKDLDDKRRFLLVKIVETYLRLDEIQQERFEAEMKQEGNKEALDMVVTWEEALADREAKGEARGRAEAERNMAVTWEEALAEREAKGRAAAAKEMAVTWEEALAKGEARGEAKAARQAVVLSAKRRFGSIPAAFEEKIQAITDPERFFEILDRILEVDSIEEVELD